ncbi:MAG: L-ribulose-5-phosphate 4-epimerase [Candidatus Atribacteria bacterium]|nr:L-ribulose-5-phosphate 4-epimerase [Candidatus Atribacteria bacterium]
MLEELKKKVYEANLELQKKGLVIYTWGNASEIDREKDLVVIKPSGVPYDKLTPQTMVVVDLNGRVVEGTLRPSVDTKIHLDLYKAFPELGGIVHTHSTYATAWAQAQKSIPCLGGTHADYFNGYIPCTRPLTEKEIEESFEEETGKVISKCFTNKKPLEIPGVLVAGHGPFSWGKDSPQAVFNAVVLEELARMALFTLQINPGTQSLPQSFLEKRYLRKHGEGATYGQNL